MKNLGNMLKQAQEMQSKMQEMQAELEALEIEGESGGGMVRVTLTGKKAMKAIKIDPSVINADDADVLEDLIIAAYGDASTKVEARMADEMSKLTGGLPLPPGFKLPF